MTGAVGGYVRAMAGALAVGNLIGIADEWGQIASRLKIATRSQEDFVEAQTRLMDIGRLTFKAYSENAELFIRTVAVLREFGGTAEDALNMTEALSLGLAVSGTKAQATASVIDQVSKSLQNGELQGDGFNAVLTQAPRLLQALQDALGKSRAELQQMASAGELTVDVVAKSWISQIGLMRQETEGMATSVADAGLRLRDAFAQYIGTADNGAQVTARQPERSPTFGRGWLIAAARSGLGIPRARALRVKPARTQGQFWIIWQDKLVPASSGRSFWARST